VAKLADRVAAEVQLQAVVVVVAIEAVVAVVAILTTVALTEEVEEEVPLITMPHIFLQHQPRRPEEIQVLVQ
jgi:hypothetical protein